MLMVLRFKEYFAQANILDDHKESFSDSNPCLRNQLILNVKVEELWHVFLID